MDVALTLSILIPNSTLEHSAWNRVLGKEEDSIAGNEKSLRSFIAFCQSSLLEPTLSPSPQSQLLVDANARKAAGLAPAILTALESSKAAQGSLKEFMEWCTVVSTVAADLERVLSEVDEEVSSARSTANALSLSQAATALESHGSAGGEASGSELQAQISELAANSRTLATIPSASSSRAESFLNELRELEKSLCALIQNMLDRATSSILSYAEEYSGEIKGGAKELLVHDALITVSPTTALAHPLAARTFTSSPFLRPRTCGEMLIWAGLTGQRANRSRSFVGPSFEVEFPKSVLALAVNVAVRVYTTYSTSMDYFLEDMGSKKNPLQQARSLKAAATPSNSKAVELGKEAEGKEEEKEGEEGKVSEGKEEAEDNRNTPEQVAAAVVIEAGGGSNPSPLSSSNSTSTTTTTTTTTESSETSPIPLRHLGGWLTLELLSMPAPNGHPKKGWGITAGVPDAAAAVAVAGVPPPSLLAYPRIAHPSSGNAAVSASSSIRVKWRAPPGVIMEPRTSTRTITPVRWSDGAGWTPRDVLEPSWNESTRMSTFSATWFVPHALAQPRVMDLPFKSWKITPCLPFLQHQKEQKQLTGGGSVQHAATFSLTTARGIKVCIHVCELGCRLISPTFRELAWLTGIPDAAATGKAGEEGTSSSSSSSSSTFTSTAAPAPEESVNEPPPPTVQADIYAGGIEAGAEASPHPKAPFFSPGALLSALSSAGILLTPKDSDIPAMLALMATESAAAGAGGVTPSVNFPPPLSDSVEASLYSDAASAASAFTLEGVPGRGYRPPGPLPADPEDVPPNSGAPILAEMLAVETLAPIWGLNESWRSLPTALRRVVCTSDPLLPRGFKLTLKVEGVLDSFNSALPGSHAELLSALTPSAGTEALSHAERSPPAFTETLRRLLVLTRPLNFTV